MTTFPVNGMDITITATSMGLVKIQIGAGIFQHSHTMTPDKAAAIAQQLLECAGMADIYTAGNKGGA